MDPAKPPTKPLAQEISWNLGSRINKIRCALLTALDIAEALKFMHKSTTLHGDLKPHNILLVTDMRVRSRTLLESWCPLAMHSVCSRLYILCATFRGLFGLTRRTSSVCVLNSSVYQSS